MVRALLIRGMLAGLVAGLLSFGVGSVFGEPQVNQAIAFEEAHSKDDSTVAAMGNGQEEELVSRKVQSTLGLLTAVVVYGAAMGGLFALGFAFLYGRVGNMNPRLLALLLALAGFAALYYVPSLKYPANPPAVGEFETIAYRTGLYFLMILISLGALVFAVTAARRLAGTFDGLGCVIAGAGIFVAIIAIADSVLPEINEVPADFPAVVLWKFRMASLGLQAMTWSTFGLLFGWLAERVLDRRRTLSPFVV